MFENVLISYQAIIIIYYYELIGGKHYDLYDKLTHSMSEGFPGSCQPNLERTFDTEIGQKNQWRSGRW